MYTLPFRQTPVQRWKLVLHGIHLGKPAIVTTGHLQYDCKYFNQDVHIGWESYQREVDELTQRYPIEIRTGIEVGFRSDYEKDLNDNLAYHKFDVILPSAHTISTIVLNKIRMNHLV